MCGIIGFTGNSSGTNTLNLVADSGTSGPFADRT